MDRRLLLASAALLLTVAALSHLIAAMSGGVPSFALAVAAIAGAGLVALVAAMPDGGRLTMGGIGGLGALLVMVPFATSWPAVVTSEAGIVPLVLGAAGCGLLALALVRARVRAA
ncbi:MAG: hypothetical protein V4510_00930 [bacterium]